MLRFRLSAAAAATAAIAWMPSPPVAVSGLDPAGFDRTVAPQDDLYRHVNGGWLARAAVPADRVTYGAFDEIADRTDLDLRSIIEDVSARPNRPRGSTPQQIADLYASVADETAIERAGAAAVQPELRTIDAIQSTAGFAAEAGHLSAIAAGGPFGGTLGVDPRNPGAPVARITQGGILLPDRDYYLRDDPVLAAIRVKYQQYLTRIFGLAGREAPADSARDVVALETALARALWTDTESRDPASARSRFTLRQLSVDMPGFDWNAWARPQGLDRSPVIILAQPSFFKAFAAMVPQVPLRTWKAWLVARYLTAAAPFLNKAFDDARFEFFGAVLTGQELPRTRWKRGVSMVNAYLGDALGRLYVERHFTPAARTRVQRILDHVLEAYRDALRESNWMSPRARHEALTKLSAMSVRVGYPASWRSYVGLEIRPDDLFGNWQRAVAVESRQRLANVEGTAGSQWVLPPQTVNAYYTPSTNEIVVPAAILQPPVFNIDADDAVNYGAAGALLGHEIGHAFDDSGRGFDGTGAARDWWTPADAAASAERTRRLAAQLEQYEPVAGVRVNGSLTVAETLADIGGLTIAYRAYKSSLRSATPPTIDRLTGDQRFFMGWAQMWRARQRDEYVRSMLQTSAHLPAAFRANAAVAQIGAFYDAFGVKPDNRLYRAPAERVRIW